ncbi:MAG: response regulator [Polyangiaceae bacterium]
MHAAVKERVLLVDDEPQVLVALEDLLGDDFVVLKTGFPEEALEMVQRDRGIAVVISDQRMPKMTGDELLAKLGTSSDARRILVTAFADLTAVVRAVNNGKIFAYVTKPWNPDDLRQKVHKAAEHFRLAQQLARERRLLDSIVTSLNEGIVAADRDGKCLLFNRQAESILGMGPRDVDPETWARHYGVYAENRADFLPAAENPLLRAIRGEQSAEVEVFVRNALVPGTTVSMTATPLEGGAGDITGGVAVLRDVTRQRELEVQLSQSQKMDAIGRLAGGVAHDFNNLLVVIQSYAELVRDGLPVNDPARGDLGEVLSAARRAASLTKQLLAFSRSEAIKPGALQLNDLVSGIEKMLHRIIGEDIVLSTRLSSDLGLVRADAGQLDQVLLNLAINARDAMPSGGQLVIETLNVTRDSDYAEAHLNVTPGEFVVLAVSDTGIGMDAETQRRVFEPFFTTKEVGKGTGLGLATVYGIVQQSGGQIRVASERGHGSVFKIYLPRLQSSVEDSGRDALGVDLPTVGGTILVVEDYAAVREVTSRILRARGYRVLEARYPTEARAMCAEHGSEIDLLLTDVIMPECTGPQLARELTERYPHLRVLYMSGYPGGASDRAGTLESDAAYIEKPFSPDSLADKIRSVMGTSR